MIRAVKYPRIDPHLRSLVALRGKMVGKVYGVQSPVFGEVMVCIMVQCCVRYNNILGVS